MDYSAFLQSVGLTERESIVYGTLLEHGEMRLSRIAQKTNINRVALYQLLPALLERGLVSEIARGKSIFYRAESPEKLEKVFEQQKVKFDQSIQELKELFEARKKKPVVRFLEGDSGINQTFDELAETLPKDGVYYRYSSRTTHGRRKHSERYYALRDKKHIQRFVITGEEKSKRSRQDINKAIKAVPHNVDLFVDNVSLIIYEDRVAFIDYENKVSFIIESDKVARFQIKLFKLLYERL